MATHYASMQDKIEGEIVRIARNQGESEDVIKFKLEKWNSIPFMPSTELLFMDIEGGTPSRTAEYVQKLLMVNIIEATDIDRSIGVIENADIGLALAASVTTAVPYVDGAQRSSHRTVALHSHKKSVFDPSCTTGQQNLIFSFSKEWFDAYTAWNLNYVTHFQSLHLVSKLLIPSILCTDDSSVRDHWLLSRAVTLKSAMLSGSLYRPSQWNSTVLTNYCDVLQSPSKARSARRRSESSNFPSTGVVPLPVLRPAILSCKDQ